MDKILVTGGAGFIGSHFVNRLLSRDDIEQITVLDALTYAGNVDNLAGATRSPRLTFVRGDVLDSRLVTDLAARHAAIVHFAAESHVDRSLLDAGRFLATNVLGTQTLLEAATRTGITKFVHVSTDEVYGPLPTGCATEAWPLAPTVPYAASKAASDLVALSYFETYQVPVCVTRSSNNYGPHQYPEKVIPRFVTALLQGRPVTIHGTGEHVRNWLHVEDNCAGIELVLRGGAPGEVYNIGGGTDLTTNQLTALILDIMGEGREQVQYIPDRRSNDCRYSVDWSKIANTLGYQPLQDLADGLTETIAWYRANPSFWAPTAPAVQAPAAATVVPSVELAS
ncbi:dTDP-glucose 4,6-dehydratase [Kitasatospora sp. MAP12-15]|uniref:dTDP-glucose 4,6-dehydratase n=1 Tax=unclassified Kitasatospora TaxID=2633591 RepID=UPI002476D952|nr:dTDP-glucose 4,6-dehydratase [Kitasatospora sp. MAP12-44]MDH6113696.1 dTDP-glucose 4,6-dehydratase [Kitasatospora sp. MAP12-44]